LNENLVTNGVKCSRDVETDEGGDVTTVGCFNYVVENLSQRRLRRMALAIS